MGVGSVAKTDRNRKFVTQYADGKGISFQAIAQLHNLEVKNNPEETVTKELVRKVVRREQAKVR